MKRCHHNAIRKVLPFLGFSIITGFLAAVIGILFKLGAEGVIGLSARFYNAARHNGWWIPALVMMTAALGLLAGCIVTKVKSCKGGGIPASAAAVRGNTDFNWLPSVFVLPISALVTFFCGIPLGTEGPCVQMGTAIGDGVIQCLGSEKHRGWRRYIMTGGASAGFSIATASPVAAILFSVEELHKKFSPLLLTGVSVSVVTAQITAQIAAFFGIESGKLFHLPEIGALPAKLLFVPLVVGVICGLGSVLFTQCYHTVAKIVQTVVGKLSVKIVFPILFSCISLVGIFLADTLGTGHALVEKLFQTRVVWYLLLLMLLGRAVFVMLTNTAGVTGGLFLPTLAFGAILGALCAEGMIAVGLLEPKYYILTVILGTAAFLGATSRIPLTACVFAVEALSGIQNILPIVTATTVAYLIAKLSGIEDFTDAVIDAAERSAAQGKEPTQFEASFTVNEDCFVAGKELCDILWPNSCAVIAVEGAQESHDGHTVHAGDVITLGYKTYDPAATAEEFNILFGRQSQQMQKDLSSAWKQGT